MSDAAFIIVLLLAAATVAKIAWPIVEGIIESILNLIGTIFVLGVVAILLTVILQALG